MVTIQIYIMIRNGKNVKISSTKLLNTVSKLSRPSNINPEQSKAERRQE